MERKLTYTRWEGVAAVLAEYPDGRMLGYEYVKGAWRECSAIDVFTKAGIVDKAMFKRLYGDIGLPSFPE